jgi:hypothetical protein
MDSNQHIYWISTMLRAALSFLLGLVLFNVAVYVTDRQEIALLKLFEFNNFDTSYWYCLIIHVVFLISFLVAYKDKHRS